jgi:alpha-tubulin suppressor-like RCC1 family protein
MLAGNRVDAVACGGAHILALTVEGKVFAWGYGGEGQLGMGTIYNNPIPMPVGGLLNCKIVVQIAASEYHSAALTEAGELYTWGAGEDGRLGQGDEEHRLSPTLVQGLAHCAVLQVACGAEHSGALTDGGKVYTWGEGSGGRCGHSSSGKQLTPKCVCGAIEGLEMRQVSCGVFHTLVLSSEVRAYWQTGQSFERFVRAVLACLCMDLIYTGLAAKVLMLSQQ